MIVEGETMALIGLMKHLRKSELRHCRNWQYDVDQMEVIAVESVPWYLSNATRSVLKDLERLLEAGQTPGSVEVRLGQSGEGQVRLNNALVDSGRPRS